MLPAAAPSGRVTPGEYLAFERGAEGTHGRVDGQIGFVLADPSTARVEWFSRHDAGR